jgi:hypothetical protein
MPRTGDRLARRYRRLLLCYPRAYRRSRGEEIVATLLEAAAPGRTRPSLREVTNLIRHGLRCRLGRPASRTIVVWAALAAVICGLFGAALATRAAWETSRLAPDRAEASTIFSAVLPDHDLDLSYIPTTADPVLFTIYEQPVSWDNVGILLSGDGGEYGLRGAGAGVKGIPPVSQQHTLALARQRLRETGWQVYPPVVRNAVECGDDRCDPATLPTETILLARRGDTIFQLDLLPSSSADSTYLAVSLERATPPAAYPAGIAGGLVGAAAAWMLFGWASRRTEGRRSLRAAVTALYTASMLVWWLPVVAAVPLMIRHQLEEPHPRWHFLWEWLFQPTFSLFFLVGCASAALGLALAALPRRRVHALPTTATG